MLQNPLYSSSTFRISKLFFVSLVTSLVNRPTPWMFIFSLKFADRVRKRVSSSEKMLQYRNGLVTCYDVVDRFWWQHPHDFTRFLLFYLVWTFTLGYKAMGPCSVGNLQDVRSRQSVRHATVQGAELIKVSGLNWERYSEQSPTQLGKQYTTDKLSKDSKTVWFCQPRNGWHRQLV